MRELEFLPEWYPRLRHRRRLVALQAWMTLVVVSVLGLWVVLADRKTSLDRTEVNLLAAEASASELRVKELDDLLEMQKQLRVQDQVMDKIGLHVETTRLLNAVDEAMTVDMSLLELSVEVSETQKQQGLMMASSVGQKPAPQLDRKLKVRMLGVTPTDVELANFLDKLSKNSLFENVMLNYARERTDKGHIMREFEVSFSIDLNTRGA